MSHVANPNVLALTVGTWAHLAYTYDRPTGMARVFVNGLLHPRRALRPPARMFSNCGPTTPTVNWSWGFGPLEPGFADRSSDHTTVSFPASGLYSLRLTASDGLNAPVSDVAVARVGLRYPNRPPSGLIAWWPGNDEPVDVVHGHHLEPVNGLSYGSARVGNGFLLNGTGYGFAPRHSRLDVGGSPDGFAIEFWYKPDELREAALIEWADLSTEGMAVRTLNSGRGVYLRGIDDSGVARGDYGRDVQLTVGTWAHLVLSYDRPAGLFRLFKDGAILHEQQVGSRAYRTGLDVYVGGRLGKTMAKGTLDELSLYARPLAPSEVMALHASGAAGKAPLGVTPPMVDAGPDHSVASAPGTVTLAGVASDQGGPFPLQVNWKLEHGPAEPQWVDRTQARTDATFPVPGTYILTLSAQDGLSVSTDPVVVRVGTDPVGAPRDLAGWWPTNGDETYGTFVSENLWVPVRASTWVPLNGHHAAASAGSSGWPLP